MPEIGREDDHENGDEVVRLCEGKLCNSSVQIQKSVAVKVCHHEVCQEINNGLPLALCLKCDEVHHLARNATHARFEIHKSRMKLTRAPSSHSNASDHDSGAEGDITDHPKVEKKTRGYSTGKRRFKLTTNSKRKPRRHNTDDPGREFFTIKFHGDENNDVSMEVVPALKGKSIKDSLEPFFTARELSFFTHSVFLDASNTPLPLAFDTFPMGGNILHVRANGVVKVDQRIIDIVQNVEDSKAPDEYQKPRSKSYIENGSLSRTRGSIKKLEHDEREKESKEQLKMSQRGKKNILNFFGDDGSTGHTSTSPVLQSGNQTGTVTLHRPRSTSKLTGLFIQPKQPKQQQDVPVKGLVLKDLLDMYSVYGIHDIHSDSKCEDDDLHLEESWTEVVDPTYIQKMNKKEKDQQEAIWELLSTEVTYIHKLRAVKKLFILCLRNLQHEGFLQDIEITKLFSNIEAIYELNLSFWLDCLSEVVKDSRETRRPLNPLDMSDSFPMFDQRFEPYITYCMEEAYCLKYFKKKMIENDDFKAYITWCEEHRLCTNRLKLSDYLVKPMQRLTKYPLLLKAIHKKTLDEDMKDEIMGMIVTVESLLNKVNAAMRVLHETNKLQAVSRRITNNYNVVEAINDEMEKFLTSYSSFDLMDLMPGLDQHRCVINEGPLRLVEKQGKMDVYVFLFTDLMLLTKAKKDTYRVLKPPLMVDKMHVHPSKDLGTFLIIYTNEYNTVVQAFGLQGSSAEQAAGWMESIGKAQKLLMVAQLGQGSAHMVPRSESELGELVSPSGPLTWSKPLDAKRRPSMPNYEESLDSDDEIGLNDSRYNSDYTLNNGEDERLLAENIRKDAYQKRRKSSGGRRREPEIQTTSDNVMLKSSSEAALQKTPLVHPELTRLRSETAAKVARSSSAPEKERRKSDGSSLSRSCSEPKESKNFLRRSSKGEVVTEGLPLDINTLVSSSSLSADDFKSESDTSSIPSLQTSVELGSSITMETHEDDNLNTTESPRKTESRCDESEPCSPVSDGSASFEVPDDDDDNDDDTVQSGRPVMRSASAPVPLRDTRLHSESGEPGAKEEIGAEGAKSATFPRRSGNKRKSSPGLQALQSLSESLESSLRQPPSRQPPIKSPLIAQQKLQSAISSGPIVNPEVPRKKVSLPRRSSPVMSRRPDSNLMRSKSYSDMMTTSPDAGFLTLTLESDGQPNESEDHEVELPNTVPAIKRTESETSRLPLKSDSLHYTGLNVRSRDTKERLLPIPPGTAVPLSRLRKKSMSLSDLLSIGKDLTSGRDTNQSRRQARLSSDTTDNRSEQKTPRKSMFRLRRSKSKSDHELKDGIASGPDIDKRKATKLYLRDSLMLESSEYV